MSARRGMIGSHGRDKSVPTRLPILNAKIYYHARLRLNSYPHRPDHEHFVDPDLSMGSP